MNHGIIESMHENRDAPKVAKIDTESIPQLSPEALQAFENLIPLLVEPETFIQGMRFLQQRIPGFIQLTVEEERTMSKAAHLPRQIVELGLETAEAWDQTEIQRLFGWTGEEQRREDEGIRRWETALREVDTLRKGIYGAILIRKHKRGLDILDMYSVGRRKIRSKVEGAANRLRPYIERMREAFVKNRKKKT